jgi:K+-transporting ATPase KdpF subunit
VTVIGMQIIAAIIAAAALLYLLFAIVRPERF